MDSGFECMRVVQGNIRPVGVGAHGDRFQVLRSHHGAHPTAPGNPLLRSGARVRRKDERVFDQVFTGGSDRRTVSF